MSGTTVSDNAVSGTGGTGGWVVWAGTLGFATPVLERLDAARHVDVQRFSVTPLDVEWAAANGISATELGRRIRDAGYDLVMDPIVGWYGGTPHAGSRFARFAPDDVLRMSAELGVVSINAIGQATHEPGLDVSTGRLADAFGRMCDRAADFGAQVHLEFTPITALADLRAGWDIVRAAARSNGGLLVDTWHFAKGGSSLELLAQIPGDRIFSVQVADARAEVLPDVRQDTQRRALPGEGVLDLVSVLRVLHRIGALTWIGPEVFSPELVALGATQAAVLSDARTREVVDLATAT